MKIYTKTRSIGTFINTTIHGMIISGVHMQRVINKGPICGNCAIKHGCIPEEIFKCNYDASFLEIINDPG